MKRPLSPAARKRAVPMWVAPVHVARVLAVLLLAPLFLAVWAAPVQAHKVNVFATVEGGIITGEASFSGGAKAQNALVEVRDARDALAASTHTDTQGAFRLPVPPGAALPLRVVLKAGEGHQNDYPVTARDLGLPPGAQTTPQAGASPVPSGVPQVDAPLANPVGADAGKAPPGAGRAAPGPASSPAALPGDAPASGPSGQGLAPLLEAAVAKAVEEKVAPLRMEITRLAQQNEKAQVRDIVGGLGWIAGLFGLAAFLRGRRK